MTIRKTWAEKREEILGRSGAEEAYEAARIQYELGRMVRRRREELGMTQAQLAKAAGLKQPAVARFEAGGTTPTIPTLERIAAALALRLSVHLEPLSRAS
ncbi:MAG: helix-turn-helix domain-containing protein [Streptosporangiales bacterium]|nr:helix-turn-helix domain-containing protein [Streptosporangiales bacterium]